MDIEDPKITNAEENNDDCEYCGLDFDECECDEEDGDCDIDHYGD